MRTIERQYCPGDLDQAAPARPEPAAGATIRTDAGGAAFLASLSAWGDALLTQIIDSQAACRAALLVDPAGLP